MTVLEAPEKPQEPLYHSPLGLFDFQAEGTARAYLRSMEGIHTIACWDTGLGKTHLGMALAALMVEDDLIDLILVVCEKNKIADWHNDFARFTKLTVNRYLGDPKRRTKIRADLPQVLVTTYETARNDLALPKRDADGKPRGGNTKPLPGPLLDTLKPLRVLAIYDEVTKLKGRKSALHKGHALFVEKMGKGRVTLLGLTATPVERDPEDYYNTGRIFTPDTIGLVEEFETQYILGRDNYDNPNAWKNLGDDDHYQPEFPTLYSRLAPVIHRKRKTDADVIDQFPKQVEEFTYVDLAGPHLEFYEALDDMFDKEEQAGSWTVLRQVANHPASLIHSQGALAQAITATVGPSALRAMGATKRDRLIEYLEPLVKGQGAQVVVFTFFGQSVLPLLAQDLADAGFSVTVNHGQMSAAQREQSQDAFKGGGYEIFLSSDAGSRGLNLQNALYVVNYEMPLLHSVYTQRINRNHRIDSKHPSVTAQSFIASGTIEAAIVETVMNRNAQQDILLGDTDAGEEFVSADQRRALLKRARALARGDGG